MSYIDVLVAKFNQNHDDHGRFYVTGPVRKDMIGDHVPQVIGTIPPLRQTGAVIRRPKAPARAEISVKKYNENHDPTNGEFSEGTGNIAAVGSHIGRFDTSGLTLNDAWQLRQGLRGTVHMLKESGAPRVNLKVVAVHGKDVPGGEHAIPGEQVAAWYDASHPNEIGINLDATSSNDAAGTVMNLTHEYGHALDDSYASIGTRYASSDPKSELAGVMSAIKSSSEYKVVSYGSNGAYWGNNTEAFARAFSQYSILKGTTGEMRDANAKVFGNTGGTQWAADSFAPISAEFDKLFSSPVKKSTGVVIRKFNQNHDDKGRFDFGSDAVANNVRASALKNEPAITSKMTQLAGEHGAKMVGLAQRVKGQASLSRKIAADSKQKGITTKEAGSQISDSVRYTMEFPNTSYTSGVLSVKDELKSEGYSLRIKNYWESGDPYQGINVAALSPSGQSFELQFHTADSFNVKENINHPLYETFRTASDPSTRLTLWSKMVDNASTVPVPAGVLSIEGLRKQSVGE